MNLYLYIKFSDAAFYPTSTSFCVIPFLSPRRIVYSLILDFSAETIWALLSRLWTFGAQCAFLLFLAYREMQVYMSRRESSNKCLFILHASDCSRRQCRRDFDLQLKLLSHIDTSLSLYDQKGSFIFTLERPLHIRDENSLHE